MNNPIITLAQFLNWLRRQPADEVFSNPVRTYCEQRFNSRQVTAHPKEIRVSFRYAWTDTYTPDSDLGALIEKTQGQLSAAEILEMAQPEANDAKEAA